MPEFLFELNINYTFKFDIAVRWLLQLTWHKTGYPSILI